MLPAVELRGFRKGNTMKAICLGFCFLILSGCAMTPVTQMPSGVPFEVEGLGTLPFLAAIDFDDRCKERCPGGYVVEHRHRPEISSQGRGITFYRVVGVIHCL